MLQLAGSTALVTGAASGIGLSIARALVAEGARVALADIDQAALTAAVEELGEAAMAIVLDATDRPGWARTKELVEAQFGPVDILVNNAGIGPDLNRLGEMPPEVFDRLVAIKLTGTFNGIHTFVPGMRERGRGHVVNTASMAGLIASAKLGAYTASKFAVVGLTEVLRAELAGSGASASVLCPGLVATNLGETTRRAGVRRTGKAPGTAGGIDPAQVGALVVQGIREDWLHIITHGEYRSFVAERSERILAAFDRAPNRSQDSLPPGTDVPATEKTLPMTPDPLFDFTGKVVLVTGGSRGLGYQMVKAFAERGADVIIASRKLDNCEAVAEECHALGRRALAVAVHVGRWAECDALIEAAYAEFGRVDVLVNNAGMSPPCPSHEMTEGLFDSVLNLNFKGPFRLASQIGHRMAEGDGGCIINISSTGALMALPGVVPYGAAKAALNAMTVSLSREYGPKVRVNTISAGPFLTDIAEAWDPKRREKQPVALGRPGNPPEIVTAALMMASPASSYTTGALLRVDGGQR